VDTICYGIPEYSSPPSSSQELDYRFVEINMELLSCMSVFNFSNSFASFYAQKVCRLAEFYPNDIKGHNLIKLESQLDNYIDDVRKNDGFKGLVNFVDLSVKLVQTNRHTLFITNLRFQKLHAYTCIYDRCIFFPSHVIPFDPKLFLKYLVKGTYLVETKLS